MTKKKILIVEGDITLAEKLADRLQEEDFTAEPVTDGKKALTKIKNEWIDAVILSLKLQGEMDGFQFFKELRSNEELSEIPVIIESDKPGMKDVFRDLGAEIFFVKPYSADKLIEKIKQIVKS